MVRLKNVKRARNKHQEDVVYMNFSPEEAARLANLIGVTLQNPRGVKLALNIRMAVSERGSFESGYMFVSPIQEFNKQSGGGGYGSPAQQPLPTGGYAPPYSQPTQPVMPQTSLQAPVGAMVPTANLQDRINKLNQQGQ